MRAARPRRPLQLELAELESVERIEAGAVGDEHGDPLARRVRERAELAYGTAPARRTPSSSPNSRSAASSAASSSASYSPFGIDQAPASFAAQNGPPMWAISTSGSGVEPVEKDAGAVVTVPACDRRYGRRSSARPCRSPRRRSTATPPSAVVDRRHRVGVELHARCRRRVARAAPAAMRPTSAAATFGFCSTHAIASCGIVSPASLGDRASAAARPRARRRAGSA